MKLEGMELVRNYRMHRDHYLPMNDHTEQVPRKTNMAT